LKAHAEILGKLFSIVWIVIGTFLAIETTTILISVYGKKRLGIGTSYLIQRLTKIGILFVSLIFVLNSLGIEISPLLASLGIAGIAVAFALQDTLANFFSGLYLTADQPIRPGDYIKVDENISGTVLEIGWRSTRLRTYDNNILIIPNKRLGESIITNYNLPGSKILMSTSIDSSYNDNPEKVEKIIYKTAKKVRDKLSTCVKGYEPVVRFYDFGSSGLKFKVFLEVKRIGDQFEVGHILRKELYNAFKKNKIEIPFTTQTVYLKKTK
jgi:small-conductance mechanosensitive channel